MSREIDKITALSEKLESAEKAQLSEALEVINSTFKSMVGSVKESFFGGNIEKVSFDDAKDALNTIKVLASKNGVDFPSFDTSEEVYAYVLKYGMEIVKTR